MAAVMEAAMEAVEAVMEAVTAVVTKSKLKEKAKVKVSELLMVTTFLAITHPSTMATLTEEAATVVKINLKIHS